MTSNMHVNLLSHHMQPPVHTRPKEVFQKPASFHPSSISASAELAKELATHDGSILAIGLLTLFRICLPLSVSPHLTGASLHSPTPFSILSLPHPTPTKPDRSAGAGRALVFTRLDWNGSLRSLRIWRYSLKCAESLTLWLRFTSNFIKLPVYTTTGTLMISNGAVILIH